MGGLFLGALLASLLIQPLRLLPGGVISCAAAVLLYAALMAVGWRVGKRQGALRAAKRIEFVLGLLKHTFGDDCSDYLEHLIGHLHHEVTAYLAEDE